MFTFADIRNIAVQIEKNGEETYRNAGRIVAAPELARLMNWMADEEKSHAEWFAALGADRPLSAEQREVEAMGKSLLQEMIRGNDFLLAQSELEKAKTIAEVISRSRTFEQDTILFYEFLLGLLDDQYTADQLQRIIAEERRHLHKLTQMARNLPAGDPPTGRGL